MIKITCDMCIDLMPLVQDGVASDDSVEAVTQHLKSCPDCSALFEGQIPEPTKSNQILKKLQNKIYLFMGMILMFGVFFGLSLTASSNLFLNTLIMPFVGLIGYYMFRLKAVYLVPCLLFVTHMLTNAVNLFRGMEHLDFPSVLAWSGIYSIFAVLGVVIAGLIHIAFKKEK